MRRYTLAIVGAGPSCTYVVERLAAAASVAGIPCPLDIDIFERNGEFGSGEVHSPTQPWSSFLNRVTGQVAFAADETNDADGVLLPRALRPTLHEWCRQAFAATGESDFDLTAEDWPKRYVHGRALCDMFQRYVAVLCSAADVNVRLHHASVADVRPNADGQWIMYANGATRFTTCADHVLFATGHSQNDPSLSAGTRPLVEARETVGAAYVPYAYPLVARVREEDTAPGTIVAVHGQGLTAIDVILYLTEERGGRFYRDGRSGELTYVPSGREPRSIVPFGPSGLFTFARPYNAKERDIASLEHKGVFLTSDAIAKLRRSSGRPCVVPPVGTMRQLDFERHIFPLVVLEMAYLYYATLYGPSLARAIRHDVGPMLENFLEGHAGSRDKAIERLLEPLGPCLAEAESVVDAALHGRPRQAGACRIDARETLLRYVATIFGNEVATLASACFDRPADLADLLQRSVSPWRNPREPAANRFDWNRFVNPIAPQACGSGASFSAALVEFMEWDHLQAAQDNIRNPFKAACDGVWRDLRPVIAEAVDFGGLEAPSHRRFLDVYLRQHNRLANGAGLEPMRKMLALVRAGILDVSIGPRPTVSVDAAARRFCVRGGMTGEVREASTLIDAKVHPFDPERDASPLYRSLFDQGLIRKWRNPGLDGETDFEPGGLALSPDFHPIGVGGVVEPSLTFVGPPTEGMMFFQLGAARPNSNHHVLNDIIRWVQAFLAELGRSAQTTAFDQLAS